MIGESVKTAGSTEGTSGNTETGTGNSNVASDGTNSVSNGGSNKETRSGGNIGEGGDSCSLPDSLEKIIEKLSEKSTSPLPENSTSLPDSKSQDSSDQSGEDQEGSLFDRVLRDFFQRSPSFGAVSAGVSVAAKTKFFEISFDFAFDISTDAVGMTRCSSGGGSSSKSLKPEFGAILKAGLTQSPQNQSGCQPTLQGGGGIYSGGISGKNGQITDVEAGIGFSSSKLGVSSGVRCCETKVVDLSNGFFKGISDALK